MCVCVCAHVCVRMCVCDSLFAILLAFPDLFLFASYAACWLAATFVATEVLLHIAFLLTLNWISFASCQFVTCYTVSVRGVALNSFAALKWVSLIIENGDET